MSLFVDCRNLSGSIARWLFPRSAGLIGLCLLCGCQGDPTFVSEKQLNNTAYLLSTEPSDAVPVGTARVSAQDGQALTIVGYIGGSASPFVAGAAVFTIVDPSVPRCAEEGAPTPWDYCCQQEALKTNMATIQFVDDSGEIMYQDSKAWLGIKELDLVMVQGIAKRDEAGNLILAAEKLYVKR
ncbi:MAG: hypothetical protein JNL67_16025 [Planctomycetaceae bacterium]|nr:hypothetical protein [Planctomycetaceae bacterium]